MSACSFPPSRKELEQQYRRSVYISQIWCNSNVKNPTELSPVNYGWKIGQNRYVFHWFDGEECPETVMDVIEADEPLDDNKKCDDPCDTQSDIHDQGKIYILHMIC